MMRQPTLFLTVGLPCTGKTTAARRIEIEQKALRLTKDEWVKALYGHENPPSAQDVIEGRLIQIGLRALELGNNVVIDYGLWGRDERSALRQAAAGLGAMVQMRYFELTPAEQRRRLDQRQAEAPRAALRDDHCPRPRRWPVEGRAVTRHHGGPERRHLRLAFGRLQERVIAIGKALTRHRARLRPVSGNGGLRARPVS